MPRRATPERRDGQVPPTKTVQLRSATLLRALVGPEPEKLMSARKLAAKIGKHPSFVGHLLTGYRNTCTVDTAQRIAAALGVKPTTLFQRATSTTRQQTGKQEHCA